MFSVFLTNFGYTISDNHKTIEEAIEAGKKAGFEFTVFNGEGNVSAYWSVFGGTRFRNVEAA